MLRFRQIATLRLKSTQNDVNLQRQLKHCSINALKCTYQTQAYHVPKPSTKRPLTLAFAGVAALSVGLEDQSEGATQVRAAFEHQPIQKWQLFDQIGAGAYGVVRLGMHETSGEVAAVKIVSLENPDYKRSYPSLEREIGALRLVKALGGHDSIIDLRDVYVEGRKLFLVTELVRGGELFEQIVAFGSFSEIKAREVAREIASALSFLHRHGLVHKDVKPENILLTGQVVDSHSNEVFYSSRPDKNSCLVKLADFGSAGPADTSVNLDDVGTAAYLPPELLTSGVCTSACDMWALGCVLYITLCGSHPFDLDGLSSDSVVEHRVKTEAINFDFGPWENLSFEAKDLISKLLVKDPALRLTADQVLQHPWIIASTEATSISCLPNSLPIVAGQPIPVNSV
ncbi:camk protein kinase [Plasmopara halstedii]|uniref:Camk protein kinase n=1 Tax=Plasmopara halstedii TaxID=4781 RepID=A0A0P1AUJ2_PLAHL|nr:camk protein kinase [Plasmopara halstedii]CEG44285.1 camk protein kinase [Plasmopara halstedii]|eukprot:XP_024580654.1 camk protein kinase [Plasmopara halstedii]